jgi:hypothetical protein
VVATGYWEIVDGKEDRAAVEGAAVTGYREIVDGKEERAAVGVAVIDGGLEVLKYVGIEVE